MAALHDLRAALLQLDPIGPDGFEGLLAAVLEKITGQPFRLAKSGLQNGKDGETLVTSNHVSFEGKLYTGKLPDNEVLTKITRLIASSNPPDVWVLGATVEASTQLLEPMQAATAAQGIATLVLDWPGKSSPNLWPRLHGVFWRSSEEKGVARHGWWPRPGFRWSRDRLRSSSPLRT